MSIRILPLRCVLLAVVVSASGCGGADATGLPVASRAPCTAGVARCSVRIEIAPGRFVPSFQSFALGQGDSLVTEAVVVVHGTERNADEYFTTMAEAAALSGRLQSTVIIAPRFQTLDDAPAADEPYWTSSGWRAGDLSSSSGPLPRLSAYSAIDTILARLGNRARFPRLSRIVVTGHSAGAQLVHRFAATSRVEQTLAGIAVRYVAANPSTWLYLGPERAADGAVAIPSAAASCPDYDDWHYGLQNRNTYANAIATSLLKQNLESRHLIVMVGTADTLTTDLDVSCGANLQGARRFQRGRTMLAYMNARHPGHAHRLVEVPGVGHSSRGMYTSPDGRRALFP
jgi:hypothetical protein